MVTTFAWPEPTYTEGCANTDGIVSVHGAGVDQNDTPLVEDKSGAVGAQLQFDFWHDTTSGPAQVPVYTVLGNAAGCHVMGHPAIATTPSEGGAVGTHVSDTAAVTGGSNPTGTVIFKLFHGVDCSKDDLVWTSDAISLVNGHASSGSATPTAAGLYHWTAEYSGDVNNEAVSSACADESVTLAKARTAITTTPSAGGVLGTAVSDKATVTGGSDPIGTVTFRLFKGSDCTPDNLVWKSNEMPLVNRKASSGGFTPTVAGTYHWTARYNGDDNNNGVTSNCKDESVTLTSSISTPTPAPIGEVGALITPATGVDPWTGIGIGGFLLLGGPAVVLTTALVRGERRRRESD